MGKYSSALALGAGDTWRGDGCASIFVSAGWDVEAEDRSAGSPAIEGQASSAEATGHRKNIMSRYGSSEASDLEEWGKKIIEVR